MAKKKPKPKIQLLRWSDHVSASDVTDPLGLGLRGSTRLASLLLYCITSITPRARYFSFIPWSISDWQRREKDQPHAFGLRRGIAVRERALTIGCIVHHDGEGCDGPGLNGVRGGKRWFAKSPTTFDPKSLKLTKNSILGAYYTSLVNLGCFVSDDERAETEEEIEDSEFTFDDIELTELGHELANSYGSQVQRLGSVKRLSQLDRTSTVASLKEFGKRGGLCELVDPSCPDRDILRKVFFAQSGFSGKSHFRRNRSLVLMLELCRQLSVDGWNLNGFTFGSSVYCGEIFEDGESLAVSIPTPLQDTATRWRMFYFHHYMSVALEGMFSWLVTQLNDRGLTGATIDDLSAELHSPLVSRAIGELIDQKLPKDFGASTPSAFFGILGISESELTVELSREIDEKITAENATSEAWLEDAVRAGEYQQSPAGLAVPCILFALTLGRYKQWEETEYGNWLASDAVVKDPYLDLLPSTVSLGLARHQGDWWRHPWAELAQHVLSRYVVQQHQSMAYEKTATGDRCLLEVDGERVISDSFFDKIGLGNPRLGSAIQILTDLALLTEDDDGTKQVTEDGLKVLRTELEREVKA